MTTTVDWNRFTKRFYFDRKTGFSLDTSRLTYDDSYLEKMAPLFTKAFSEMEKLEAGEIVNEDEKRMVGHYWLRDAKRAPSAELRDAISNALKGISNFARDVHSGTVAPPEGGKFTQVVVVGIGGSALGPQFVNQALSSARDPMSIAFFDNTDPDGMAKVLNGLPSLKNTLFVIISKSGGTKETRNGQLIAKEALKAAGVDFARRFVAVTGDGSELDNIARKEEWLARFPMWDWVGGRTSEFSAVGLLPAALQGFAIDEVLRGAAVMDELTRVKDVAQNPAALMALGWYYSGGGGKGTKDMVILPYKDRLELFSRYLQQLVMESLGKELDRGGAVVNQGIAVYGNKGSTDQHAYVQQLREGLHNFFAIFIEVLQDKTMKSQAGASSFDPTTYEVESKVTSGDYLQGFFLGTRDALFEKGRESITVTIPEVNEFTVGMLIALFERTVGLYASLVNINAYHQPGVEAGKKAAADVLKLQLAVMAELQKDTTPRSAQDIAKACGLAEKTELTFKVLRHLAANGRAKITEKGGIFEDLYSVK